MTNPDVLAVLAPLLAPGEAQRARASLNLPCPSCHGDRTVRNGDGTVLDCPRCGGTGRGGTLGEVFGRLARPDLERWQDHVGRAGGCEHPIRLRGESTRVDTTTGEVLEHYSTTDAPDGVLYLPCNNRRETACPACAERYRYDTYHLVAAGLRGGKGVPEQVASHPRVFLTLTAPSFGPVHGHHPGRAGRPAPCRPRRRLLPCRHGRPTWCTVRHSADDPRVGTPLCGDCYDYPAAVLFNRHVPELWRYFTTYLPRELARLTGLRAGELRELVKLSYVKVGEYQRRGVIHLHAVIRLDAAGDTLTPPPGRFTVELLSRAVRLAAATVRVPTATGLLLRFGPQTDVTLLPSGQARELGRVAGYLGKYVTKTITAPAIPDRPVTAEDLDRLRCSTHYTAMIRTAWDLGGLPCPNCAGPDCPACGGSGLAYPKLRRWAHALGFGGHVITKSRRYSTTMTRLRRARRDHARAQRAGIPLTQLRDLDDDQTVTVLATWTYAGRGYHTSGDAWLAISAAARAREHRRAIRELAPHEAH